MRLAGRLGELAPGGAAALDAAAAEERHLQGAGGRAHAVGPAGDLVVGSLGAGDDDDLRLERAQDVDEARDAADRQHEHASARAHAEELERAQGERVGVEVVARGVADEDGGRAHRRRREALRALQPVGRPARGEGPGRAVEAVALAELVDRGQQHLLDRALDGAQREGGLHRAVGAVELEGLERADEDGRVRAQGLARAGDGRRDRQALLQRVAQRGHLAVRVEAVLAGRALRLGVAETTLPGTERVRADVQHGSRFRGLQRAHGRCTASERNVICAGSAQLARNFRFILCISLTGYRAFISVFSAERPPGREAFRPDVQSGVCLSFPPSPPEECREGGLRAMFISGR